MSKLNRKKLNRQPIEEKAEKTLRDSAAYRVPVPIEFVAQRLNLKTEASFLDGKMSGVLVVENGRGAIGYNSTHASVRQRFSIAHEIGHYVLHAKNALSRLFIDRYLVYRRDDDSCTGDDREEVEANAFAAALLMPAPLLHQEIAKHDYDLDDEDDLSTLAKRFNVSTTAMSFRLVNLGLLR